MENNTNKYVCRDCGSTFELTKKEERFFTDKGLLIPKRCPDCRKKRRTAQNSKTGFRLTDTLN
jgi:DNA-directed RNA polymerase subunit RPC12/RpoP